MNKTNGFILINKPEGITSHDVIKRLRAITGIKKIGHAGTLDPMATGLLIVGVGRQATKNISKFMKLDKEYEAEIFLGAKTDTYDKEGKIIYVNNSYTVNEKDIKDTLFSFVGTIEQIPPMYSAKKVRGTKLYEMAREGIEVERDSVSIRIYDIDLIGLDGNIVKVNVKCGTGTYIRSLTHDIGEKLGCGGYLRTLKRSAIGKYLVTDANKLEDIDEENWNKYLF